MPAASLSAAVLGRQEALLVGLFGSELCAESSDLGVSLGELLLRLADQVVVVGLTEPFPVAGYPQVRSDAPIAAG